MRTACILLLLVSLASAAHLPFLNLSLSAGCPNDWLRAFAFDQNGTPVPDLELRLVLWEPYYGLRALNHTDADGSAYFQLKLPGTYQVYPVSNLYQYDKYTELNYTVMCPPPPPKQMEIIVEGDCNASVMRIDALENSTPLEGVFISSGNWSSLTGSSGEAVFPLVEGLVAIHAEKKGYDKKDISKEISCAPPPECLMDEGCTSNKFCQGGKCENVSGECGYPENHTWVRFGCCNDSDCGNESVCTNKACVQIPPPAPNANNTDQTNTPPPDWPANGCAGAGIIILSMLLVARMR